MAAMARALLSFPALTAMICALFCIGVDGWREWFWDGINRTQRTQPNVYTSMSYGGEGNISYANNKNYKTNGPPPRRGHSILVYNKSRILVFGGLSNREMAHHTPKTFAIEQINGQLEFISYENKTVIECEGKVSKLCRDYPQTPRPAIYNDLWTYDLACDRVADDGCLADGGWTMLDSGAHHGGCLMERAHDGGYLMVCTHPVERHSHISAVFDDGTLVVHGGFAEMDGSYAEDMWAYNLSSGVWRIISQTTPVGRRWKAGTAHTDNRMYMFGGYRLWHGFSAGNTEKNMWKSLEEMPKGGYLDDLWYYDHNFDHGDWTAGLPGGTGTGEGNWTVIKKKKYCYHDPGKEWALRNRITCTLVWPEPRMAAAVALRGPNEVWVHGGYSVSFPYPKTSSSGAGPGVAVSKKGRQTGSTLYPSKPYYRDDLWVFNMTTGYWTAIQPATSAVPAGRAEHTMIWSGLQFIIYGGYRSNYYFQDLWQFDPAIDVWLEKNTFVHGLYPKTCVNDLLAELWAENDFVSDKMLLEWRSKFFEDNPGAKTTSLYEYATKDLENALKKATNILDPVFLNAFVGSRDGQPTRFHEVKYETKQDNVGGRYDYDLIIPQPGRRSYGWDGCRDRVDGQMNLPGELQWERPPARWAHKAVFAPLHRLFLMFGGQAYEQRQYLTFNTTHKSTIMGDLWEYSLDACPHNCSNQGDCSDGYCFCFDGFYGLDCSNISCPGDYCYYNQDTKQQVCSHCCYANYTHNDKEHYHRDVRKIPCSEKFPGRMNGMCDGFGHCQCVPPFIGQDCSIRDCVSNCSGHGKCQVEFPVSRCYCDPGFYGDRCAYKACLNNCSWPNGICDDITGRCSCRTLRNPYNKDENWTRYAGDDCTFMTPWAGRGSTLGVSLTVALSALWVVVAVMWR